MGFLLQIKGEGDFFVFLIKPSILKPMKLKKKPNANLRKNSSLYFVIGLCLMLFITWRAIERKSYEKTNYDYQALDVNTEEDDNIPITEQIKTPPPPPVKAPTTIEVVEDEEDVEETVIESTETNEDEIVEVENIATEEEEDINIPFAIIEDVPIFPGCEKVKKSTTKRLFSRTN
jgi:protein TonB